MCMFSLFNIYVYDEYRTIEIQIEELTDEKISLTRDIEEAKSILSKQEEDMISLKSTVTELTAQLTNCQAMREEAVYRAAK